MLLAKGMIATEAAYYWVAQLVGGIAGAAAAGSLADLRGDPSGWSRVCPGRRRGSVVA